LYQSLIFHEENANVIGMNAILIFTQCVIEEALQQANLVLEKVLYTIEDFQSESPLCPSTAPSSSVVGGWD
jgi:hypothetical protein